MPHRWHYHDIATQAVRVRRVVREAVAIAEPHQADSFTRREQTRSDAIAFGNEKLPVCNRQPAGQGADDLRRATILPAVTR